ncbi:serpin B10-like isoform X1 [Pleurodeles waltl]|uniref:serpin B10-like isoform X1 n=1 Tax=Pleurodeles waltl TaxID=8319 RepID=UPI00370970EB
MSHLYDSSPRVKKQTKKTQPNPLNLLRVPVPCHPASRRTILCFAELGLRYLPVGAVQISGHPTGLDPGHRTVPVKKRVKRFSLIQEINMEELNSANSEFCFKFYKEIAKSKKHENIFFSPLSIMSAMGMVYRGASGNTATQMGEVFLFNKVGKMVSYGESTPDTTCPGMEQQALKTHYQVPFPKRAHLDEDVDTLNILPAFKALNAVINKPSSSYTLETASNMYVEKTYPVKKGYVNDIKKYYEVQPESVNLAGDTENTRKKINGWVEDKTKNKIKNLVPEGALDQSTVMVLVNAIYFKGDWADKFSVQHTEEREFKMSKTSKKPVQMMFKRAKFNIAQVEEPGLAFKVLELPYVNKDLSMIILLPNEILDDSTGLEKLEYGLNYEQLSNWTRADKMDTINVEVFLPKFKMEEMDDLTQTLGGMGMSDAFSQGIADFSGMSEKNDLYVSKVLHKAYVYVNEEGTEAAAATSVGMVVTSLPITVRFEADHPFIFIIRHNKTDSILFCGRFCSP